MPKHTITQTASQTFIHSLSIFKLKGPELCVLEFDEGNNTPFADRIILQSTGKLLFGQLELDLKI
jgi:hypothetical protein